jgi:hypothetical protein
MLSVPEKKSREEVFRSLEDLNYHLGYTAILRATYPQNLDSARKEVFENYNHDPVFELPQQGFDTGDIESKILELRYGLEDAQGLSDFERHLILELLDEYELRKDFILGRDSDAYAGINRQMFCELDRELLDGARKTYANHVEKEEKTLTPRQQMQYIKLYFNMLGRDPYEVEINSNRGNVLVNEESGLIEIPCKDRSPNEFRSIVICHDSAVHPSQYLNSLKQPSPLFRIGFPGRIFTSEGLGYLFEERAGGYAMMNKMRSGELVAMDIADQGSFKDVYNYLISGGFDEEDAFRLAMHSKRGYSLTDRPGACLLRNVYNTGRRNLNDYVENGGNLDLLLTGRVAVEYADQIEKLKGLYIDNGISERILSEAEELQF